MILSNNDIRLALKQGRLRITPLPEPDQFAPSALDLRVGNEFLRWKSARRGAAFAARRRAVGGIGLR